METLLQFKLLIQTLTTAGAAASVLIRPWTAIPIYLFAFALPNLVTKGSAPLVYPELSLGIPILLLLLISRSPQSTGLAGWLRSWVIAFVLLLSASCVWGAWMLSLQVFLGLVFLLAATRLVPSSRHFWWLSLFVAAYAVLLALYWLKIGTAATQSEVFDWFAYEQTGDRNYNSFQLGVGAVICWCLVSSHVPAQFTTSGPAWSLVVVRVLSGLGFCICGWAMMLFQSRGLTLALAVSVVISLLHRRLHRKYLILGVLLAAAAFFAVSVTPAYDYLLQRWQDADVYTASERFDIWRTTFDDYRHQSTFSLIFGKGANAILAKFRWSSHNSFLTILVEQGVMGVALLLGILGISAFEAWKRRDELGQLQMGLLAFSVAAAQSIEPHVNPLFWLVLALALPLRFSGEMPQKETTVLPPTGANAPRKRGTKRSHRKKAEPPIPNVDEVTFGSGSQPQTKE